MGYVTVRGGEKAIEAAEALFRRLHPWPSPSVLRSLEASFPLLLDRIMAEAGLWAPSLAAEALAQTAGDTYEAVLLLRAYRTTLPRLGYTQPLDTARITLSRRISAAARMISSSPRVAAE